MLLVSTVMETRQCPLDGSNPSDRLMKLHDIDSPAPKMHYIRLATLTAGVILLGFSLGWLPAIGIWFVTAAVSTRD